MRGNWLAATILGALLLAGGAAFGSGFAVNEHDAKAMGIGGAYTAIADRPGAMFYNPAGLATLPGLQLEAGITLITPGASYIGPSPETGIETEVDAVRNYFFLPNIYATYRLHEMLAAGLGFFVPYGLTQEWPDTVNVVGQGGVAWWGRGIIQRIALQTFYFTPQVAVNIHPRVQLGAGLYIVRGTVELQRAVTFGLDPARDIQVELGASDTSFSATAGLMVTVIPDLLKVGFSYRGGPSFEFTGNAAFTRNGSASTIPAGLRSRLSDGPATTSLDLPHVFSFGLATFPMRPLTIAFQLDVVTWSNYNELAIQFQPTATSPNRDELNSSEPKDWSNTIAVRIGAEYRVIPSVPLRVGFIYDQGAAPIATVGPELPDADRYEFTLGAGWEWRGLRVDLAYQFLTTSQFRAAEFAPLAGSYQANAHLLGLSLGYALSL